MSKFAKALNAAGLITRHPVLQNRVLQETDIRKDSYTMNNGMDKGLPVLSALKLYGDNYSEDMDIFTFPNGGSRVTDNALLKSIARYIKDCRYFEFSTLRGKNVRYEVQAGLLDGLGKESHLFYIMSDTQDLLFLTVRNYFPRFLMRRISRMGVRA